MRFLCDRFMQDEFSKKNLHLRVSAKKIDIFPRYTEENAAIMVVIIWDGVPQKFCYGDPHSTLFSIKGDSSQLELIEPRVRQIVADHEMDIISSLRGLRTETSLRISLGDEYLVVGNDE